MMLKINPKTSTPGNETEKHFLLKNVALSVLKNRFSSKYAATEVGLGFLYNKNVREKYPDFNWRKKVSDAVGIQRKYNSKTKKYSHVVRNIEVKVSMADLRNGYCTTGDYNYIMAPKGVLDIDEILPFMGFIEVDLEKLSWKDGFSNIEGVEIVRNPTRINKNRKKRMAWIELVKDHMLKNYTNEHAFRGLWFYPGFIYRK